MDHLTSLKKRSLPSGPEIVCAAPQENTPETTGKTARSSRNFDGPWPKTPGRVLGTGLIRLYQLTLSGFVGQACRHQPTCSEYAYEAVARFGLIPGSYLAFWRVMRCTPWGTSGFDPVPEKMRWLGNRMQRADH